MQWRLAAFLTQTKRVSPGSRPYLDSLPVLVKEELGGHKAVDVLLEFGGGIRQGLGLPEAQLLRPGPPSAVLGHLIQVGQAEEEGRVLQRPTTFSDIACSCCACGVSFDNLSVSRHQQGGCQQFCLRDPIVRIQPSHAAEDQKLGQKLYHAEKSCCFPEQTSGF